MTDSVPVFRSAYISVRLANGTWSREIYATGFDFTVSNRSSVQQTDAAFGIVDDLAKATYTASFTYKIPTSGFQDYLKAVITPGRRQIGLRISTADGKLELRGTLKSVAETKPDDPAGHQRTCQSDGVVVNWMPVAT